jgi:hypothetical protein
LWEAGATGSLGLPSSIGELKVYRKYVKGVQVYAQVQPRQVDGQMFFDARVVDGKGNVYLELNDYRTSPLPYPAEAGLVKPMKDFLIKEHK